MWIVKLFTVIDRYLPPPPPLDTNINLMTGIPARSDPWRLFRRQNQPGTSSGSDVCRCFRRKNIWSISVLLLDDAGRRLHIFFAWWGHPGWKLGCKNSCVSNVREDIFYYLFGQFYFFLIFYAREDLPGMRFCFRESDLAPQCFWEFTIDIKKLWSLLQNKSLYGCHCHRCS